MKRVFFTKDYHHRLTERVSVTYRAHYEGEVEDEVADIAIVRGAAMYSSIAEDDLFNHDEIAARGDAIREEFQAFLDHVLEDEAD